MSKLEKMLKYVSEHNEFYKNRIKEYGIKDPLDINQWPILTRKELQENRYNMFSDGYKSKYFNQQLRRQSSSGSSGVPVNVYWDYKDWYASNMSLWRKRFQWYKISPNDRHVVFSLSTLNEQSTSKNIYHINTSHSTLSVNVSLIQNDDGYNALIDIVDDFKPKWLYIQPLVLDKLIQAYIRTGKRPPKTLRYVESVGELLSSNLRKTAMDFFQVPVANMYGSNEMNGIAYECPNHHMHVLEDNVFVETANDVGIYQQSDGNVVITNINNRAMPLIRYAQGDKIKLNNIGVACSCCDYIQTIEIIKGREVESIIFNDKCELCAYMLLETMGEINNIYVGVIKGYKFIYTKQLNCLRCFVMIDKSKIGWFKVIKQSIEENIMKHIPPHSNLKLDILDVDSITFGVNKNKIIEIVE